MTMGENKVVQSYDSATNVWKFWAEGKKVAEISPMGELIFEQNFLIMNMKVRPYEGAYPTDFLEWLSNEVSNRIADKLKIW